MINARSHGKSHPKLELPKQYYAILTHENELLLMTVMPSTNPAATARFQLTKLPLLNEQTIGVFLDEASQSLFILGENLSWRQYSLRSRSLSQRKRNYMDALSMLEVHELIDMLMKSNENFFKVMR